MTNFWSGYIVVLTLTCLGLILWLLLATRKGQRKEQTEETLGHSFDGIEEFDNPLPRWWFVLFIGTMVFGAIYLFLFPGLGKWPGYLNWTQESQYEAEVAKAEEAFAPIFAKYSAMPVEEVAKDPEAVAIGQRLFATNCSVCHGSDARGLRLPEPDRQRLAVRRRAGNHQDHPACRSSGSYAGVARGYR